MKRLKVCVLRTAGTNCDKETAFAFNYCGADAELIHINSIMAKEKNLSDFQILAIPGGFSYGDDVAAGKILANELKYKLSEDLKKFIKQGKLILGICNGFQVLVKAGILPGNSECRQEATLMINDSGKFEDRWVYLKTQSAKRKAQKCVWVKDLPEIIYLPVAHGEGKFITGDKSILERIKKNGQIVFQYCNDKGGSCGYPQNPNGSEENIAGICDASGGVLGLMPHPERHSFATQHPRWMNTHAKRKAAEGLLIFKNGVEYAKKY
jgi:phosphoribosylformylglycinamidine synthase